MTAEERNRIDALTQQVAEWRVEMKDELLNAVHAHQTDCLGSHLAPMKADLSRLVEMQMKRDAVYEERARKRAKRRGVLKDISIVVGILGAIAGVVTPFVLHLW